MFFLLLLFVDCILTHTTSTNIVHSLPVFFSSFFLSSVLSSISASVWAVLPFFGFALNLIGLNTKEGTLSDAHSSPSNCELSQLVGRPEQSATSTHTHFITTTLALTHATALVHSTRYTNKSTPTTHSHSIVIFFIPFFLLTKTVERLMTTTWVYTRLPTDVKGFKGLVGLSSWGGVDESGSDKSAPLDKERVGPT